MVELSKAHALMASAMDYRAARQDLIAGNIANADTPFYQPRDVRFEEVLATKKEEIFKSHKNELQMAQTSSAHLGAPKEESSMKAKTFFRDGHQARNDGNSVDIDVETTELSKNSTMYKALTAALKKEVNMFNAVILASQKTN